MAALIPRGKGARCASRARGNGLHFVFAHELAGAVDPQRIRIVLRAVGTPWLPSNTKSVETWTSLAPCSAHCRARIPAAVAFVRERSVRLRIQRGSMSRIRGRVQHDVRAEFAKQRGHRALIGDVELRTVHAPRFDGRRACSRSAAYHQCHAGAGHQRFHGSVSAGASAAASPARSLGRQDRPARRRRSGHWMPRSGSSPEDRAAPTSDRRNPCICRRIRPGSLITRKPCAKPRRHPHDERSPAESVRPTHLPNVGAGSAARPRPHRTLRRQ